MIAPKYRTDAQACSCPGYWYRRTCRHYRAYRDAVSLVLAQDAVNKAYPPIPDNLSSIGVSPQSPIPANLAPIGETVSIHHTGQLVQYESSRIKVDGI